MARRALGVWLALAAMVGCKQPSEIDVQVVTDVACSHVQGTSIAAGGEASSGGPTLVGDSTSHVCASGQPNNSVGKLVILPSEGGGAPFDVLAVMGVDVDVSACNNPPNYQPAQGQGACIVQRRRWQFVPGDDLPATIVMPAACANVVCSATETCTPLPDGGVGCVSYQTPTCNLAGCHLDAGVDVFAPVNVDAGDAGDTSDSMAPDAQDALADVIPEAAPDVVPEVAADVVDAPVDSSPLPSFTISGTLTGLAEGDTLIVSSGASPADLTLTATGLFTFEPPVPSGTTYAVTAGAPTGLIAQTCAVTTGTGTIADAPVTDVVITCTTASFTVGGTVTGLSPGESVGLANGVATATSDAGGTFAFPPAPSGSMYTVTVTAQPPGEMCTVNGGTGTIGSSNVTVTVSCIPLFSVGGTVSGLSAMDTVIAADGAGDQLFITSNGAFTFNPALAAGTAYAVTLVPPLAPVAESCTVTSGSGTVGTAPVTNVSIVCAPSSFTVGGTVVGLESGSLTLQDDAGDNLVVGANGSFMFPTQVQSGSPYDVTILSTSGPQTCAVSAGSGTVGASNVTGVVVACGSTFVVGGTVSGLAAGDTLELQDNGGDNLFVTANGSFAFPTALAAGAAYAVTVLANPPLPTAETCTLTQASGTVTANVTSVQVACAVPCPAAVLADGNGVFYAFNPPSLTTTALGKPSCPGADTTFNLAGGGNGTVYMLDESNHIYAIDVPSLACVQTAFVATQLPLTTSATTSIGFAVAPGAAQMYYIGESSAMPVLASSDLTSFTLTKLANVVLNPAEPAASIKADSLGNLVGLSLDGNVFIFDIATGMETASVATGLSGYNQFCDYTTLLYGGTMYLFTEPSGRISLVSTFDEASHATTTVGDLSIEAVGAALACP